MNHKPGAAPGGLTGARHGCRVRLGAEVSFVAGAGGGSFPDGVAVQRALGAGAVAGQGAVVADLTGWREQRDRQNRLETSMRDRPRAQQHRLGPFGTFLRSSKKTKQNDANVEQISVLVGDVQLSGCC